MFASFWPTLKKIAPWLALTSFFLMLPLRFFLPELRESMVGLAILGLLLTATAAWGARDSLRLFLRSRRAGLFLNTLVLIMLFVAVLVLVNILGIVRTYRVDTTAAGEFTLSPQSVRVVRGIPGPVEVIGFFPEEPVYEGAKNKTRELLEEYRYWNNRLTFRFVDPEVHPALAQHHQVKVHGTIVFTGMGRRKAVLEPTEENFTGALLELSGLRAKKVYFLTGNGEHDPAGEDEEGYGEAKRGLIRDLYQVQTLDLKATGKVPEDCTVLIMAGTQKALSAEAFSTVKHYLEGGGKALVLLDPNPPQEINLLLSDWGLTVGRGKIIDPGAYVSPDMGVPAVFKGQYPAVVIARGLDTTYFPGAAPLRLSPELNRVLEALRTQGRWKAEWPLQPVQFHDLALLPAVLTTPESWLEGGEQGVRSPENTRGVQPLAVMIIAGGPLARDREALSPPARDRLTRLVVIGDSDFAANRHFRNGGNGDLFLNAVNWLAEEEHLISIRPKPYTFRRLLVSPAELRFIRYSSLVFLPLLLLLAGGVIWWRRR